MKKHTTLVVSTLVIFTLLLGCSKKNDEVAPVNIVGSWTAKSTTGTATINGKKVDIKDLGFDDSPSGTVLSFKSDGTGTSDGEAFTYTLTGNKLKINQKSNSNNSGDLDVSTATVSVANKTLTLTINTEDLVAFIAFYNAFTGSKITDMTIVATYAAQ